MPTLPQPKTQCPNPGPTGTKEEMGSKAEGSKWAAQARNKNPILLPLVGQIRWDHGGHRCCLCRLRVKPSKIQ